MPIIKSSNNNSVQSPASTKSNSTASQVEDLKQDPSLADRFASAIKKLGSMYKTWDLSNLKNASLSNVQYKTWDLGGDDE